MSCIWSSVGTGETNIGLIGEQKCYIQIGLMLSQAGVKYQLVLYGSICLKMVNSKSLKFF